jgi:cytochrome P450
VQVQRRVSIECPLLALGMVSIQADPSGPEAGGLVMLDAVQTGAEGGRLIPPAILPPARDPSVLILAARMKNNQIAGWPKAMFEEDAWRPPIPGAPLFVMHPAAVKTVLTDDVDFPQGHLARRVMRPAWGKGLLTAQLEDWRAQRHAAAGAFRPADMAAFAPTFARFAETALGRWTASTGPTDILAEMSRVTFDIILETMLSGGDGFGEAFEQVMDLESVFARMRLSYFLAPDAYHAGRAEPLSAGGQALAADILAMVRRRRGEPERGDLVDLLIKAGFDDELLADNLRGFMVAGHGTTAVTLAWALYLVAAHPPTAARIRAEADALAGVSGELGPEQAQRLTFTRQVICEAMRLYPTIFVTTRVAQKDVELAGHRVKAGRRINIPIYAIHRHRRLWSDPDVFDPDRFAPGAAPVDRYSYLPFGAGPRICLGATFAMVEATTILATLVRAAEFELVPGHEVRLFARVALMPEGGMPLRVRPREG